MESSESVQCLDPYLLRKMRYIISLFRPGSCRRHPSKLLRVQSNNARGQKNKVARGQKNKARGQENKAGVRKTRSGVNKNNVSLLIGNTVHL